MIDIAATAAEARRLINEAIALMVDICASTETTTEYGELVDDICHLAVQLERTPVTPEGDPT